MPPCNIGSLLTSAARLGIGILFLSVGLAKCVSPSVRLALRSATSAIGMPRTASGPWIVAVGELVLGTWLASGVYSRWAASVAGVALTGFSIVLRKLSAVEYRGGCGCSVLSADALPAESLQRNVGLMMAVAILVMWPSDNTCIAELLQANEAQVLTASGIASLLVFGASAILAQMRRIEPRRLRNTEVVK